MPIAAQSIMQRQLQYNLCSLSWITINANRAAMSLNDFLCYRHSKTCPAGLSRIKWDKNVFKGFLVHARTLILDSDLQMTFFSRCAVIMTHCPFSETSIALLIRFTTALTIWKSLRTYSSGNPAYPLTEIYRCPQPFPCMSQMPV